MARTSVKSESLILCEAPKALETWQRWVRWSVIAVAIVGLVLLAAIDHSIKSEAAVDIRCMADSGVPLQLDDLDGLEASSQTLELAGTGRRISLQLRLRGGQPESLDRVPTVAERMCIEARIERRWKELTNLDTGCLIPTFVALSILFAAWVALCASADRQYTNSWIAVGIVGTALALMALDVRENVRAQDLLVLAETAGSLDPLNLPFLDPMAGLARDASLAKWLASAPWALAIALGAWRSRHTGQRVTRYASATATCATVIGGCVFAVAALLGQLELIGWGATIRSLQVAFAFAFAGLLAVVAAVAASSPARFKEVKHV